MPRSHLFRSRAPLLAFAALLAVMTACGDKRIRSLAKGISRDSAMKLLGSTPADSTALIYHNSRFIVNGQNVEVLYYDEQGRKRFKDSVGGEELTPVVITDGKVEGWGWANWDSVAKSLNIVPLPHKAR